MRKINKHHIIYNKKDNQEWIVPLFAGEHKIITLLGWYSKKSVSKGLIKALKFFILKNEDRAMDLKEDLK